MAHYYKTHPLLLLQPKTLDPPGQVGEARVLSEYNKHCETLLAADTEEGWASELCCYLGTMQQEVTMDTDLIEWWQVRDQNYQEIDFITHHHSVGQCHIISYPCMYSA